MIDTIIKWLFFSKIFFQETYVFPVQSIKTSFDPSYHLTSSWTVSAISQYFQVQIWEWIPILMKGEFQIRFLTMFYIRRNVHILKGFGSEKLFYMINDLHWLNCSSWSICTFQTPVREGSFREDSSQVGDVRHGYGQKFLHKNCRLWLCCLFSREHTLPLKKVKDTICRQCKIYLLQFLV